MSGRRAALDPGAAERFAHDGFLVLEGFYDVDLHIEPIRRAIHEVIGLVAADHGVDLDRAPYAAEAFDDGYLALKAADRRLAGVVYDVVKQLAPFVRLVAASANEELAAGLRGSDLLGVAGGGAGIRIDNPDEDQYRAWWHQEYPAQFRSLDGLVMWSPLRTVTPELGPIEVAVGSHREGLLQVERDERSGRSGAYALRLAEQDAVVARHEVARPLARPGDLVVIDYLTVHRSGRNRSTVPRWTMQFRYFNLREATGRSIGWTGSFAAGRSIADVHPELEVRR
ncbi:hypothetical protein BH10ACT1_BH10ACT1_28670 [soil metagenome]